MQEQIQSGSSSARCLRGGSEGETFNLLIVDAGKEEKRVEYCVLEELGEKILSEDLDGLVCME